jgi:RNA polymerase sigma factor (sigma-70 family)
MGDGSVSCTAVDTRSADRSDGDRLLEVLTAHKPLLAQKVRWAEAAGLLRHSHQRKDAWQAARIGFIQAYRRYDHSFGASVGAFARHYVMGAVREALATSSELGDVTSAFDTLPEDIRDPRDVCCVDTDATSQVEAMETARAIRAFLADLPPRQQQIVTQVFWQDRAQADVARDLGVSRKTITTTLQKVYARGREVLAGLRAA